MLIQAAHITVLTLFAGFGAAQVLDVRALAAEPLAGSSLRPEARPLSDAGERHCTADGATCILEATYVADVCRVVEWAARAEDLNVEFFARLLWRESLFEPSAVSPKGAQGIAQFMPGTAALRGLADPFNPAEAILASAEYLKELEEKFGNLGLAAAAYNAGEARVERFLAGTAGLPGETRDYVLAITDYPVEVWRRGALPTLELALDPGQPFLSTCAARVASRDMPGFAPETPALLPWAVVLTGRDSREAAEDAALRLSRSYSAILRPEEIVYTFSQYPGMQQPRHFAQVGRRSRVEAEALCQELRAAGAGCAVRRN
jgi:hypothetical protein